jgi:F-type H+-transporting ATPase subunit epsilon
MSLQVKIVTPSKVAYEGSAEEVQVPGWSGEYGALAEHANMLTLSRPGVVKLHRKEGLKKILVGKGFAEVTSSQISLLVDLCEDVESIDKESANEELVSATSELAKLDVNDPRYGFVENRLALAQARVEA